MPSFFYNSKASAVSDHCNLLLQISHRIDLGAPSDAPLHLNSATLKSLDIIIASDLVIGLSGSFAGAKISPEDISQSHLVKHLVEYLRMNATQLGLSYVSGVIHDQGDDKPKVIIRPACLNLLRLQHMPTCATLRSLDLAYTWQIPADSNFSPLTDPFAPILALPYLTLLDDVVERFVKWHLVKRYPLIFGSWRRVKSFYVNLHSINSLGDLKPQQLGIESDSSLSIYRSIRSIIDRSDNNTFRKKCENKFMTVKEKLLSRTAHAAALLNDIVPGYAGHSTSCLQTSMGDEEVLCLAMERLFQASLQPSKFQMSRLRMSDRVEDEQLSQSLTSCPTDDSQQRDPKCLWESPSISPSSNPIDFMGNGSSFAHFPLGLYDQWDLGEGPEMHSRLAPDQSTCDWDEILKDDLSSSQAVETSETGASLPSTSLLNKTVGAVDPKSCEESSQEVGDSGAPSATCGIHRHLMELSDFGEDVASDMIAYCHSHNMDDKNGSSEEPIFTLENDVQNSQLHHYQGSAEDLFAQDQHYGIEIDLEGTDSLGNDSWYNQDHSWGDDNDILPHVIPGSTTGMPTSVHLHRDSQEVATGHVPSFILSGPHLIYHASNIASSTCSSPDQKESHGWFADGATAQFNMSSELSRATIWDRGNSWEPDSEVFIALDTDWEEDRDFLNLIDEESE